MPRLTAPYPKAQGGTGPGEKVDWESMEGVELETGRELQCSSNETAADDGPQQTTWTQALCSLPPWRGWYNVVPVGVLWSLCQVEALQHLSFFVMDVCWRLLLVCLLWAVVGGCVYALKGRLRPGQNQEEPPQRIEQEVVAENRDNQYSWVSQSRGLGHSVPLAIALADSLLLCVLQEPLPDPSVPQVETLLSRLESVFQTLEQADSGSGATLEEVERDSVLKDRVKLIRTYLQQRMRSLRTLIQAQRGFEASVKDLLEGVGGLWAQLEELHTGVTLTKEGRRGHRDLALAQTDAETLLAVLGHFGNKLQSCQVNLKDCTQLLQELIWGHSHIRNSVSSSSESVWAERLLQSNIEQFDKVQESFRSLEQQTCTFQAHLEGLGKGNKERHAGPLAHTSGALSSSVSPQTSSHLRGSTNGTPPECCNSTSASTSASSVAADSDTEAPLSLCERSALQVSSTIGLLRKSGRKK
ncbi:hypothetical protein EXN66_Car008940 [Channa argus]|uniref:Uncharacterized protein n=1 Tax=Channa argus TaxID=215402 RepID=A0A6G1PSZ9_CHAAH|nr:hypothetical protein EXN66_Car008940 [Channa argus]KAK2912970.1 hypothetical protein Q8A73_007083 [Channa argus]